MSANVGLSTPRGSGTSGYVQRNLSVLKPRSTGTGAPYNTSQDTFRPPKHRKPDADILRHDRLREIENAVLALRDSLEDENENEGKEVHDSDEIDSECDKLRARLISEMDDDAIRNQSGGRAKAGKDGIKKYQVHELAEAKIRESDRLRRALGLKGDQVGMGDQGGPEGDGKQGGAEEHPMARQERRKKEREMERARVDLERSEYEFNDKGRDRERERERDRGGERDRERRRERDWDRDRD